MELNEEELLNKISEQGEIIEDLQNAFKEFLERRTPVTMTCRNDYIFMSCDDGSVWALIVGNNNWTRLPDVPQPEQN